MAGKDFMKHPRLPGAQKEPRSWGVEHASDARSQLGLGLGLGFRVRVRMPRMQGARRPMVA